MSLVGLSESDGAKSLGAADITSSKSVMDTSQCTWAHNYPEVQRACYLARVCTTTAPKQARYRKVTSIIQKGPTCGLTILSMLFEGQPTVEELLQMAKDNEYTHNGEMFCAKNMCDLTCKVATAKNTTMTCRLHEGRLNCDDVKASLAKGSCFLVPYPFQ